MSARFWAAASCRDRHGGVVTRPVIGSGTMAMWIRGFIDDNNKGYGVHHYRKDAVLSNGFFKNGYISFLLSEIYHLHGGACISLWNAFEMIVSGLVAGQECVSVFILRAGVILRFLRYHRDDGRNP